MSPLRLAENTGISCAVCSEWWLCRSGIECLNLKFFIWWRVAEGYRSVVEQYLLPLADYVDELDKLRKKFVVCLDFADGGESRLHVVIFFL